ncbi:diacylglycerol/lipid kinase family protein [Candidatus Oscillochloris fontis]|uniref:diacylglycerol/lipid kinase family protein n=1 Tax=Candidatus Oscillochloris fontis TaxID=2496868 RepID=UPI00101CD543
MRTRLIFNPTAGNAEQYEADLTAAALVWRERGWSVELTPTRAPGDGVRLAYEAARQGYDLVVAAGGDGTINEVINGLVGSSTALATLPLGTMNVWARELRLPLQPRLAAQAMLSWKVQPIDLGRAGDRYFLLMAGIGFDAAITAGVRADEKRRFGALAYVLRGIEQAINVRGARSRIKLDGRTISGRVLMVVIGNSQLYGGVVKITHRASIDDGLLDVCVIRGDNGLSALRHLFAILRRRYSHDHEIEYYRARSIQVTTTPRLPVQVDGDAIGQTPMLFTVAPRALYALMPPDLPDDLTQQNPSATNRPRRTVPRLLRWLLRRS